MAGARVAGSQGSEVDLATADPQRMLLDLLRLQSIVLANPEPVTGLRTMVDLIFESPEVTRASVGVPLGDTGRIRYLAQAGGLFRRHDEVVIEATPIAAKAMATRELVQMLHTEDAPHTCIHAPIVSADAVLGFFAIGIRSTRPLPSWHEQAIWATSDLMALLLLNLEESSAGDVRSEPPLGAFTPRQREVLLDLVQHGEGNAQMADRLGMNKLTVKVHLQAIYRKLGVHNRAEAISTVLNEHPAWLATQRSRRRDWPDAV